MQNSYKKIFSVAIVGVIFLLVLFVGGELDARAYRETCYKIRNLAKRLLRLVFIILFKKTLYRLKKNQGREPTIISI